MTRTIIKDTVTTLRGNAAREPLVLRKRIGTTIFIVNVRFSDKRAETMQNKLLRLIESEVRKSA